MPPHTVKSKKAYLQEKRVKTKERKEKEAHDNEVEDERWRLDNMNLAKAGGGGGGGEPESRAEEGPEAEEREQELARSGKDGALTSLFARDDDAAVTSRRNDSARALDLSALGLPLHALQPLDLPFFTRPEWDATTTAAALEAAEERAFEAWKAELGARRGGAPISPFERNLEVWRQLWRTLEKASVVIVAADVRNPLLHLPASLFRHLAAAELPAVVCLTKTDLVSRAHVAGWLAHLQPLLESWAGSGSPVRIATFCTKAASTEGQWADVRKGAAMRRRAICAKRKEDEAATRSHADALLALCSSLSSARRQGPDGLPAIGVVGQPNTGKSSVLNELVGEHVVSVSRSCGHTKHWQTHLVQRGGQRVATLIDSPGLIFPLAWPAGPGPAGPAAHLLPPRHVLEVSGLYPIAQIREPLSAVRLLAEHLPLELLYNLSSLEPLSSPHALCEAFAEHRGYTLEGGGPDVHRAGLEILRDCVDGYVLLAFAPPAAAVIGACAPLESAAHDGIVQSGMAAVR